MNEPVNTNNTPSGEADKSCQRQKCCSSHRCHGKPRFARFFGLMVILGIGFMVGKAFGFEHGACYEGSGMFISGKAMDAEMMSKVADKQVLHMLSEVDASKEQKTKASEIVKLSVQKTNPLAIQMRDNHQKLMALMHAKVIDKDAIEQLRAEQMKTMDEASKNITQALLDIGAVLTPEQRASLADKMENNGGWMHH